MNERLRIQHKREKATAFPSIQSDALQDSPFVSQQDVDEVPSSVQEVLSSSGQPLGSETRAFMEPRFGHDFSQVRVHTDERAVESAEAVNAQAYTVGQDVVFGEGQYAPGTNEGKRLLAHELTHVMQQEPGSMRNTTASAISKPNASHEIEAEQASLAIVSDSALKPVFTSKLHLVNSGTMYRRVWLNLHKIDLPGWGDKPKTEDESAVYFQPYAELFIGEHLEQTKYILGYEDRTSLKASPGSSGTLRIVVDISWFQNNVSDDDQGEANITVEVPFAITPQGIVAWQAITPNLSIVSDVAEIVAPAVAMIAPYGGYVTVSPIFRGAGSVTSSTGSSDTFNIGGGKFGVTGGYSHSDTSGTSKTTQRVMSVQRSYTVELHVPKPTPVQNTTVQNIDFTNAYFKPGSAELEEGQEQEIEHWYESLTTETKNSIVAGATEIRLEGHASTTGHGTDNLKLSKERVQAVQAFIPSFAGSHARFNPFYYGEYKAKTPDNVEVKKERYVLILVITTQVQAQGAGSVRNP